MDTRYPIRKADGREYKNYDELMTDLGKVTHGRWLVGLNRYWHGGIHIGDASSPASVLSQEEPEKSVPLQCMAEGEVVAWRVNRDYNCPTYYDSGSETLALRHSATFLLVRSVYKPDEHDESGWLTLYHLYMHMAPLSEYPKRKLFRVTEKGDRVRLRRYSPWDENREFAPDVMKDRRGNALTLKRGEDVVVLRGSSFTLQGKAELFGLAQRVKDGNPEGDLFWVSLNADFLEPKGECYVCLPVWMHNALNHGVLDEVVIPPVPLKVTIKAGDAIGFLGAQDIGEEYSTRYTTEYKTHIELLSTDTQVSDFLSNVKGIKTGRQYVKLKLKKHFYLRNGDGEHATFTQMSAITRRDSGKIIAREQTQPFKDKDGVTWFCIRPHTWMHEDDVEQLSQHDLSGLYFHAIEAAPTTDFTHPLEEGWMTQAVKNIASHFDSEKGPDSGQAKMFYDSLLRKLQMRNSGGMTEWDSNELNKSLFSALHSPQMAIPEVMRRLVVKHDSDWHSSEQDVRWSVVFDKKNWHPMKQVNASFLEACRWMDKVPPFTKEKSVWHFHPLEFLEMLKNCDFPKTPINEELTPLEFINFYNGDEIEESDYVDAASKLGCEVAAIKAVAKTETGSYGAYFKFQQDDDYVPAILFERHHFHKYTDGKHDQHDDISNPVAGGYGTISAQYSKLVRAYSLNKRAALKSTSWGKFQILASNYAASGYSSPEDFVLAISKSEKNQLKAFVSFIKADNVLLRSIRSKDWLTFARRYNGPKQKDYDLKMEKNYNALL